MSGTLRAAFAYTNMAITEITIEELAAKVEQDAPLTPIERKTAGAMVRAHGKILAATRGARRKRYTTDEERKAARRETQRRSNAKRRGKLDDR